jgi:hypothetical protein
MPKFGTSMKTYFAANVLPKENVFESIFLALVQGSVISDIASFIFEGKFIVQFDDNLVSQGNDLNIEAQN